MTPKRISVKFFTQDPEAPVDLEPFIPLFHRVIQQQSVEGLLLDVADYAHVPNGPGVLLIGHEVDYGIDATSGQSGLLTRRKRAGDQSLPELLEDTLRKALGAVKAIQDDGSAKIQLALDAVEVEVLDRMSLRGVDDAAAEIRAAVGPVFEKLYAGSATIEIAERDARAPLALTVRGTAADVETLLGRLGGAPLAATPAPPQVPGQTDWDVSAEQLKHLRESGADFVLVDVREQQEMDICEIGGKLMPLGTFGESMGELDKAAHIIVHCHVGGRSARAVQALRAAGFDNAWNLQGGIRAWIQRIDSSLQDY